MHSSEGRWFSNSGLFSGEKDYIKNQAGDKSLAKFMPVTMLICPTGPKEDYSGWVKINCLVYLYITKDCQCEASGEKRYYEL